MQLCSERAQSCSERGGTQRGPRVHTCSEGILGGGPFTPAVLRITDSMALENILDAVLDAGTGTCPCRTGASRLDALRPL